MDQKPLMNSTPQAPAFIRPAAPSQAATQQRQLSGLTTLLTLEKEARHAPDINTLGFICVNETLRLLPYEQALFWQFDNPRLSPNRSTNKQGSATRQAVSILSFSGVAQFDADAPQVVWLRTMIIAQAGQEQSNQCHTLTINEVDPQQQEAWLQWSPAHVLWVPLPDPHHDTLLGGLWLARDQAWEVSEQKLAEHLASGYAHALALLKSRAKQRFLTFSLPHLIQKGILIALLVGVFIVPVRQSVLAPATVVAEQPTIIATPTDGVVYQFHVVPNQGVEIDQPLFDLDPTDIDNRLQVAKEELAVAVAHYQKAENQAFNRPESAGELASLRALMARSALQVEHAEQLLQRLHVTAPVAGVVMFSDINQWLGRPVRVGERILSIADPHHIEVEALLPVADALILEPGAETRLFLNTDPLHPLAGKLRYASYEASTTASGILAYRLRSVFLNMEAMTAQQNGPRLGLKGTIKLFGEKVPLFFYLFRRPFAALRQQTGW